MKSLGRFTAIIIISYLFFLLPTKQANASFGFLDSFFRPLTVSFLSNSIIENGELGLLSAQDNDSLGVTLLNDNSLISSQSPITSVKTKGTRIAKSYIILATAYSSTVDQTDHNPLITASGTHVREGVVAANFLPFGTVIRIPELFGEKIFIVEDRMNKRYPYQLDIWFPTRSQAKEFGIQKIKIELVS